MGDGKIGDTITEYVLVPTTVGDIHSEVALFYVAEIESPVIFGLRWLQRHNPRVNWETMELTFGSHRCRTSCLPPGLTDPPTITAVNGPPYRTTPINREITTQQPPRPRSPYRAPTVEDAPEDPSPNTDNDSAIDLTFDETLTPGFDHYKTRTVSKDTETRARMIPNKRNTRPAPAPIVSGCRRKGKPLPKLTLPPLS